MSFLEKNIKRLEEIGVGKEEILDKVVKNRWILEYTHPTDRFFLKFAYFIKFFSRYSYRPQIIGESEVLGKSTRIIPLLLKSFPSYEPCRKQMRKFMRENFHSFLNIENRNLSVHEFMTLTKAGMHNLSFLHCVMEMDMSVGKEENLFVFTLSFSDCISMYLELGEDKNRDTYIFGGEAMKPEQIKDILEGFIETASRVFALPSWETVKDYYLRVGNMNAPNVLGIKKEDFLFLLQIERFYRVLTHSQILKNLRKYPIDFSSFLLVGYSKLIEYFL